MSMGKQATSEGDRMPAEDAGAYLPHEAPMVLLSGCVPAGAGEPVEAWVEVGEKSPFFDAELGGVPGCVALEYMAQAAALWVGRMRAANGMAPAVGFVLGTRRMEISVPAFVPGVRYAVRADCSYRDEAFAAFDCEVLGEGGRWAAAAQITAFQPKGVAAPEDLEVFA